MLRLSHVILAAALPFVAFAAQNDMVILRDGTEHTGTFVQGNGRTIVLEDAQGNQRRFELSQVRSIDFGDGISRTAAAAPLRGRNAAPATRAVNPVGRTIPADTEFTVRTNEAIETKSSAEGRTYSANVEKDVLDTTGNVVIPKGSPAELIVRAVDDGTVVKGSEVALDVQSVTVGGRNYLVSTSELNKSSDKGIGKNRRTAEMVGGGAALGTLLGAIAGGGKGAAIGAIAGAAAGGAVQVITKGKEVKVPAETVLTFKLDQPFQLSAR